MQITPKNETKKETKKIWYVEGRSDTWENETHISEIVKQYWATNIDDAIWYVKDNYEYAETWTIEEDDLAKM